MTFIEMIDLIRSNLDNVHSGSILEEEAEKVISDILTAMFTGPEDATDTLFNVKFVSPSKAGDIFVVRTYPSDREAYPICRDLASHTNRGELVDHWHKIKDWNVEINLGCVKRSMYHWEGNLNISSDGLAAMIVLDVLNVVKSDNVIDTIYDAYCDSYISDTEYDVRRDGTDVGALSKLYLIPILEACFIKEWIVMSNPIHIASSLNITVSGVEDYLSTDSINAYKASLATLIRNNGNTDLMKTPEEKFQKVSERMLWASRYYRDYVKRRSYLRDELTTFAMRTSSPTLRVIYLNFLDQMGMELHERYTGAVVEGTMADNWNLFSDSKVMFKYSIVKSPKKYSPFDTSAVTGAYAAMEGFKTRLGLLRSRPMLPSEKEIDLIFVDIDRMSDQYARKMVLNNIYDIIDRVTAFEEYYSDDDQVMKRYSATINNMLDRLNEARVEVLNKRSFKDNYKVFVNSPAGYEG